ncbi:MAG: acyl carrier protein [Deltaproteobacteria bacterium]|nr:acyl carrier protein [Deltaproteobacteria bacterium]
MTDKSQREALVLASIAEILEMEPGDISHDARMREDLGMDSLGSLELLSTLSRELNVDLEIEQAMEIETVADTLRFVEEHVTPSESA